MQEIDDGEQQQRCASVVGRGQWQGQAKPDDADADQHLQQRSGDDQGGCCPDRG